MKEFLSTGALGAGINPLLLTMLIMTAIIVFAIISQMVSKFTR